MQYPYYKPNPAELQMRVDEAKSRSEKGKRDYERFLDQVNAEYQWQMDRNTVNQENRYADIGQGMYDLWQRQNSDVKGWGDQQKKDAEQRWKNTAASLRGNLTARGLANSSGQIAVDQMAGKQYGDELGRINQAILGKRLEVDNANSNNMYGFMERRTDTPPDYNQLYQLQYQLGKGGPGSYGYRKPQQFPMPQFPGRYA